MLTNSCNFYAFTVKIFNNHCALRTCLSLMLLLKFIIRQVAGLNFQDSRKFVNNKLEEEQ